MKTLFSPLYRALLPVAVAVGFATHEANAQLQTNDEISGGIATPANNARIDSLFIVTLNDAIAQLSNPKTRLTPLDKSASSAEWKTCHYEIKTPGEDTPFNNLTLVYHNNALDNAVFSTRTKHEISNLDDIASPILTVRHFDNDDIEVRTVRPEVARIFFENRLYPDPNTPNKHKTTLSFDSAHLSGSFTNNDTTGLTDIYGQLKKPFACQRWETLSGLISQKITL